MSIWALFLLLLSLLGGAAIIQVFRSPGISVPTVQALGKLDALVGQARLQPGAPVAAAGADPGTPPDTAAYSLPGTLAAARSTLAAARQQSAEPDAPAYAKLESYLTVLERQADAYAKADAQVTALRRTGKSRTAQGIRQHDAAVVEMEQARIAFEGAKPPIAQLLAEALAVEQAARQDRTTTVAWILLAVSGLISITLIWQMYKASKGIPKALEANVFAPLQEVRRATREIIRNGKLEEPVAYEGKDEIGDLVRSFNEMANVVGNTLHKLWEQEATNKESNRNLRRQEEKLWGTVKELKKAQAEMREAEEKLRLANGQLEHMNANLDRMVHERTQALQNTLTELRGTQNKMILSEKMAVLGQLVASVAHEINSPLGAIKSSIANIKENLPDLLNKLPPLVNTLDEQQRGLWAALQRDLRDSPAEHMTLNAQRELRKTMINILEREDVEDADEVARNLIDAGFRTDLEKYLPLFEAHDPYALSRLIYQLGAMYNNTKNIELAITKTNKIVFNLKNYSRRQDDDVLIPINMQESLETILVLYHNKIKHGIELHTSFGLVPPVLGNGDELGQVWTNIIANAVQAMGGKGLLDLKLWEEDGRVKVRIQDDGPGIPEDIREKIFEPFFTTKKKGEGTGLGLDICKKIIEKHGGTIRLDSESGKGSTFTIELPAMREGEMEDPSEEEKIQV
jgi:signal transduction histidine kinase